jgi:thiol-disulfide isomerase/thioredoxin
MEDKLVFVDVATTWCGPCKQMAANVFPDKEVGELFNKNFINFKIDAEKGDGIKIAQDYGVREYPTYLFVDGAGVLVYRSVGYFEPIPFMGEANVAISESKDAKPYANWEDQYIAGNREKDFLLGYLNKRGKLKIPSADIVEEVFPMLNQSDLNDKELMSVFLNYDTNTRVYPKGLLYNYVIDNQEKIDSLMGISSLYVLRTGIFNYFYNDIISNRKEALLPVMDNAITELFGLLGMENPELTRKSLRMTYYGGVKDVPNLIRSAREYANNGLLKLDFEAVKRADKADFDAFIAPYRNGERDSTQVDFWKSAVRLNASKQMMSYSYRLRGAAELIYKNVEDPKVLEEAAEWARIAEDWFPHFSNKAVYSGLLFKLGRTEKAIGLMQLASEDPFIEGDAKAKLLVSNSIKMKNKTVPESLW